LFNNKCITGWKLRLYIFFSFLLWHLAYRILVQFQYILFVMQFKMAQEYFESAKGGLIVDVSCGSGLFSRKFAKSGAYSGVIALDFSENMLRQCYEFIKKDDTLSTTYSFPYPILDF